MKKLLLATLFSTVSATSVHAIENLKTVCSHGNQTRVIEVVYTTDAEVPCEVRYSKEDGMTTPWSANNSVGYCEKKAAAFVDKQESWGWACEAVANDSAEQGMAVSATEETAEEPAEVEGEVEADSATEVE